MTGPPKAARAAAAGAAEHDRLPAVVVDDLHVTFGAAHALDGVDFAVARGTTLGVLGHNGAGKTTLVRVLTTLARPTAGRAVVNGFDVRHEADQVRRRVGVTGQNAGLDEFLTGHENLELIGRLDGSTWQRASWRRRRFCSSTSRPPASTRRHASCSGTWSPSSLNPVAHTAEALRGNVHGAAGFDDTVAGLVAAVDAVDRSRGT